MTGIKRKVIVAVMALAFTFHLSPFTLRAQAPGTTPVKVSTETQTLHGRKYYVHIVETGQTVYSISKAYKVESYDAVTHVDIHFLHAGDTVWLPVRGQFAASPQDMERQKQESIRKQEEQRQKSQPQEAAGLAEPRLPPILRRTQARYHAEARPSRVAVDRPGDAHHRKGAEGVAHDAAASGPDRRDIDLEVRCRAAWQTQLPPVRVHRVLRGHTHGPRPPGRPGRQRGAECGRRCRTIRRGGEKAFVSHQWRRGRCGGGAAVPRRLLQSCRTGQRGGRVYCQPHVHAQRDLCRQRLYGEDTALDGEPGACHARQYEARTSRRTPVHHPWRQCHQRETCARRTETPAHRARRHQVHPLQLEPERQAHLHPQGHAGLQCAECLRPQGWTRCASM